jgi:hypothetical protein
VGISLTYSNIIEYPNKHFSYQLSHRDVYSVPFQVANSQEYHTMFDVFLLI